MSELAAPCYSWGWWEDLLPALTLPHSLQSLYTWQRSPNFTSSCRGDMAFLLTRQDLLMHFSNG